MAWLAGWLAAWLAEQAGWVGKAGLQELAVFTGESVLAGLAGLSALAGWVALLGWLAGRQAGWLVWRAVFFARST